ncbi:MAG: glycosyl transferase family 4 [Desulfurococcales archaeon]|nr:glycosyl transferase family 4 [Desulfurococcales archaeon]
MLGGVEPLYLAVSVLVSLVVTVVLVRAWIPVAHARGFVGFDKNKPGERRVAEMGGVWAINGAVFGLLVLVALYRYLHGTVFYGYELFGLSLLLFMAGFIGLIDDILGWKKGLRRRYRILATIPIALPLVVIQAGVSRMNIPLLGTIDLGLLYPLVLVPIGVMGAANAFNMIAGYNGLEAGMGLLLMLFTAYYSLAEGLVHVFYASMTMAGALAGFLVYNWYPARVFPGNTLTYAVGAYYAGLVIIGNFEKFGLTLFALYFIEFALYLRGRLHGVDKENFASLAEGRMRPPYERAYSLTHIALMVLDRTVGATEVRVVLFILSLQALVGLVSLALFLPS